VKAPSPRIGLLVSMVALCQGLPGWIVRCAGAEVARQRTFSAFVAQRREELDERLRLFLRDACSTPTPPVTMPS